MSDFYSEMQDVASELMGEFKQGAIQYVVTEEIPGAEPWEPPVQTLTRLPMDAVAFGVTAYQTDEVVTLNDTMIKAAVFAVEPEVGGIVEVDGKQRQILRVKRIPDAGTVVAWEIYVKG